ncbi:hypothetical protein V0242_25505 (plasmid) [Aeromonas hydrophila]|uniref:hypothetical protein n=1 Tax=Aeromonas hydrophila TaxID=644 RepID=UPI002ED6A46B|nr:hypothetical protein V0242_25505 [Aeromonas hydrophila]
MFEHYCGALARRILPFTLVLIVFFTALNAYTSSRLAPGGDFLGMTGIVIGLFQGIMIAALFGGFYYAVLQIKNNQDVQNQLLTEQIKLLTEQKELLIEQNQLLQPNAKAEAP